MKNIVVVCGSGVATSTVVTNKIKDWLKEQGMDSNVKITQSTMMSELNNIDDYDAVVSTTTIPDTLTDKVISGLPLLTGIGGDEVLEQIGEKINTD
ncbi:PTS sugar transporter subunit IIB [Tetragenococcus halophilus]|uniref:PTS galactitol transporter subunit IIB n=1 Tax=Tetragenococcus halophilus TaxID=51669 RepID=A0AB37D2L8_TETHA|nr:PTS sugar transporter subunit IIB [Tetragenococcus halophilus]QGP76161.1 PTS galactitol transporter subunit IIB [Tetragenococcus halophilus]GFK23659.1 galactitol-specific PTS system IIB component [Tetragenococcus halophilus]GMA08926.1 PTS galactitol transporter subunit IIB [Tetragenococcus halophilus subsp. flandriensis]GMG64338.1 PTS sugar transporter subunit IIB [Tetragenococcus halophilus]GMG66606.1 PTS sugar transporter subunit IIB [Tetragenococcus halophilus]